MSDLVWHTEKRNIADLKEFAKNPRKITKTQFDHIKASIQKFGLIDKPFINTDNTIIGGHQRLRILHRLGYEKLDVHVPNRTLTDKEVEELNYRHNENSGDWDYDILANQYELSDLLMWGEDPLEKEKQETEPKLKKPKVTFEFESQAAMEDHAHLIEEASRMWDAKMKIKK